MIAIKITLRKDYFDIFEEEIKIYQAHVHEIELFWPHDSDSAGSARVTVIFPTINERNKWINSQEFRTGNKKNLEIIKWRI